MPADVAAMRRIKPWLPAVLFVFAVASSAWIWGRHAWPVLTLQAAGDHLSHFGLIYVHALGGTGMLAAGGAALFLGWRRRRMRLHRIVAYTYLTVGGVGAVTALWLSLAIQHEPRSLGVSTAALAVVWLAFAAMAARAARNRRFDSHQEWAVRTYVVSWTFVGCRLAGTLSPFDYLGLEGVTAAIWLFWITPVLLCELALQWPKGAPRSMSRS